MRLKDENQATTQKEGEQDRNHLKRMEADLVTHEVESDGSLQLTVRESNKALAVGEEVLVLQG